MAIFQIQINWLNWFQFSASYRISNGINKTFTSIVKDSKTKQDQTVWKSMRYLTIIFSNRLMCGLKVFFFLSRKNRCLLQVLELSYKLNLLNVKYNDIRWKTVVQGRKNIRRNLFTCYLWGLSKRNFYFEN